MFAHPPASVTALRVAAGLVLALVGVVSGTVALVVIGVLIEWWALFGARSRRPPVCRLDVRSGTSASEGERWGSNPTS